MHIDQDSWDFLLISEKTQRYLQPIVSGSMMSSESPAIEGVRSEEPPEAGAEPTMINVRSEGLKLDLVLLKNRVSGLTLDYQNISENRELRKWLRIIDGMLSDSAPSPERSIPQILGEAAKPPASQPEPQKEEHEEPPQENDYRKVVLHAVDVSLDTLGSAGKQAVLSLLENRYGLSEKDIPDHPRGFVALLDELLGPSAQNLEREIISNIRLVSAAPGENLKAVVESLEKRYQTTAPVEAATENLEPISPDASPVAIASTQEEEGPSEEKGQDPGALKDSVPAGFSHSLMDPIPVGFRYSATYSRRRD